MGQFDGQQLIYNLEPRRAVLCAYARFQRGDGNTWDYEARYGAMVRRTAHGWNCGEFWAREGAKVRYPKLHLPGGALIETWFDRNTRLWVTQLKAGGNQVGEASYDSAEKSIDVARFDKLTDYIERVRRGEIKIV